MGLSPQSSGIRLNSAAIAAAAAASAAAAAAAGAAGASVSRVDVETDGVADDELSTSPDGDSPISSGDRRQEHQEQLPVLNIPPPSENHHHLVQHQPQHPVEETTATSPPTGDNDSGNNRGNDEDEGDLFEENSLEELIAQAPSVAVNSTTSAGISPPLSAFATSTTALGGTSSSTTPFGVGVVDTPVESLISQGIASIALHEQQQQQHHQAPYLELSPSKQRTRHYHGVQVGSASGSPKKDEKSVAVAAEEDEEDETYGDVEPSEQEESDGGLMGSREVRRAASLAKATMHGLRDDLLGDKS